jgi:hypothetical protein
MMIRCKMKVEGVVPTKDGQGVQVSESITLRSVTADSDANKEWSKWTPSAMFAMSVTNPNCFGQFALGEEVYIDISHVPSNDVQKAAEKGFNS